MNGYEMQEPDPGPGGLIFLMIITFILLLIYF